MLMIFIFINIFQLCAIEKKEIIIKAKKHYFEEITYALLDCAVLNFVKKKVATNHNNNFLVWAG